MPLYSSIIKQIEQISKSDKIHVNVSECCYKYICSTLQNKYNYKILHISDISEHKSYNRLAIVDNSNISGIYIDCPNSYNINCYCSSRIIKNIFSINDINISYKILFFDINKITTNKLNQHICRTIFMNMNMYINKDMIKDFDKNKIYQIIKNDIIGFSIYIIDNKYTTTQINKSIEEQTHNNNIIIYYTQESLAKLINYKKYIRLCCSNKKLKDNIIKIIS